MWIDVVVDIVLDSCVLLAALVGSVDIAQPILRELGTLRASFI